MALKDKAGHVLWLTKICAWPFISLHKAYKTPYETVAFLPLSAHCFLLPTIRPCVPATQFRTILHTPGPFTAECLDKAIPPERAASSRMRVLQKITVGLQRI